MGDQIKPVVPTQAASTYVPVKSNLLPDRNGFIQSGYGSNAYDYIAGGNIDGYTINTDGAVINTKTNLPVSKAEMAGINADYKDSLKPSTLQTGLQTGAAVVNAATGAYGAYLGGKQLDLAEKEYALKKDSYNSNMLSSVDQYNNTQANRSGIAQAMSGMSADQWQNNSVAQSQFAKLDANKYKVT